MIKYIGLFLSYYFLFYVWDLPLVLYITISFDQKDQVEILHEVIFV